MSHRDTGISGQRNLSTVTLLYFRLSKTKRLMCLIFLSINNHSNYKLILAGNRDEFYQRKTASANFWKDHVQVIGGRDLEAGGTWLAMTQGGKIGMVTNYRDPQNINPNAPSRGHLVSDFLVQND